MTQEERHLVLKDLCGRLTTDVIVTIEGESDRLYLNGGMLDLMWSGEVNYRPYLRPMSSMAEEERNEYFDFRNQELQRVALAEVGRESAIAEISDWFNAHHFDYRGLIEKGLALKAPDGMYKTE